VELFPGGDPISIERRAWGILLLTPLGEVVILGGDQISIERRAWVMFD
jgi:hypothetical protein